MEGTSRCYWCQKERPKSDFIQRVDERHYGMCRHCLSDIGVPLGEVSVGRAAFVKAGAFPGIGATEGSDEAIRYQKLRAERT
jgi:hypothetical protein